MKHRAPTIRKNNNFLVKLFISISAFVFLVFAFGPYRYFLYSAEGILYYIIVNAIFLVALGSARLFTKNNPAPNVVSSTPTFVLSSMAKKVCVAIALFSIVCALLYSAEALRIVGVESAINAEDTRILFGAQRSSISKIAEFGMFAGPASFLILSRASFSHSKTIRLLSYVALLLPGVSTMLLGARWRMFVVLLLMLFSILSANAERATVSKRVTRVASRLGDIKIGRALAILMGVVVFALAIWAFMRLFASRGLLSAQQLYLFVPGDMSMRPFYESLLAQTSGAIEPLYKVANYIAQSPAVFSRIFEYNIPDTSFLGAYMFRVLSYFIPGFPDSDMSSEGVFGGLYSGFVYGFIIDFGILIAPIVVFTAGILLSKIEQHRFDNKYCFILYPVACSVVACAPFYYFVHVGSIDYVLFWFAILVLLTNKESCLRSVSVDQSDIKGCSK